MQIRLANVRTQFNSTQGQLDALGPLSFDVPSGQFVSVIGPSGSGKSTLIRAVAGLQPPTSGQVFLDDQLITAPIDRVGLMFQDANLMPWRTVIDNIALPLEINGLDKTERYKAVRHILPMLGLADFASAYPAQLSGGMAQRVALGRILVQRPRLLLLDEPFGALDALTREKIRGDLLKIWGDTKPTVIMVTHDIQEAVWLSDRVLVFSQRPGRIIADVLIDLPRPRHIDMVYSTRFLDLVRQLRTAIDRA